MQAARLSLFRQIVKARAPKRCASSEISYKVTMDDLPHPKGTWQEDYDRNQRKYNRDLILGILVTAGTLAFGEYCGYHRMYGDVPETPAVIDSYVEQFKQ